MSADDQQIIHALPVKAMSKEIFRKGLQPKTHRWDFSECIFQLDLIEEIISKPQFHDL